MTTIPATELEAVTEAVLIASRALVAVAARSLAGVADDVTLPQFRALVVLDTRGPQPANALAEALSLHPSTITRMVDRLVDKKLVARRAARDDRREIPVSVTRAGRRIVADVTARRREEIAEIIARIPRSGRAAVVAALRAFAEAAGEAPDQAWSLGWSV